MNQEELLKSIFDYLDGIKKPFDQRDSIGYIRMVVNMVEDGLSWTEIKRQLP